MLYIFLLSLTIPFALCAPIQQWSFGNKNSEQLHTEGSLMSLSAMNQMIHDDIQGYYENILDEVISINSEDILVQMAHSMNDHQSLEHLLQPQAIALLHHPVQEICLGRMPGMIAHHLHGLHTKLLESIEPTLSALLLKNNPMMMMTQEQKDVMKQLTRLNNALDQQVMQILNQEGLEHKVALDLSVCEIQQNQLTPPSTTTTLTRPPQSLWLLLKDIWKQAARAASSSRPGRMIAELGDAQVTDLDHLVTVVQDDSLLLHVDSGDYVSGSSLLRSYLDRVSSSLHAEFNSRLPDLYAVLKTDVFDEEIAA